MAFDTTDVIALLENRFDNYTSHAHESNDNGEDIHVVVEEDDIGALYETVRDAGLETNTFRSGDVVRGWLSFEE